MLHAPISLKALVKVTGPLAKRAPFADLESNKTRRIDSALFRSRRARTTISSM